MERALGIPSHSLRRHTSRVAIGAFDTAADAEPGKVDSAHAGHGRGGRGRPLVMVVVVEVVGEEWWVVGGEWWVVGG